MVRPRFSLPFAQLTAALSCIAVLGGCGIVTFEPASAGGRRGGHGGRGGPGGRDAPMTQADSHAELEGKAFPSSVALLKQAEDSLAAQQYSDALDAVQKVPAMFASEKASDPKAYAFVSYSEAFQRLDAQRWMVEGLALRGLGKDLEALIAVHQWTFDPRGCRIDLRPRCEEHAEWLSKTFPGVVTSSSFVALSAAASTAFTHDLSDLEMNVSEREIQAKAKNGYVAVRVQPTSKKDAKDPKDGVVVRVDGSTSNGSYDDCNKVGQVRIGDTDFDVKRCAQQSYTAHRVDFVATVPADDAARLTGAPGEEVLLVFDVKKWKKNGTLYTSGPSRIAYVSKPRK